MTGRIGLKAMIAPALAAAIGLAAGPALAAMSADEVKANIEDRYPVEVLKVEEEMIGEQAVYRVTMMFKGGNYNTAFQVNTIIVDVETGEPVPQFGSAPSGHNTASGARTFETNRQTTNALSGAIRR